MIPQRFPEANTMMVRPKGWTEEECSDIHAFVGDGWVNTAWRPTPTELMKLNLGEPVYLMLKGGRCNPRVTAVVPPAHAAMTSRRTLGSVIT